MTPGAILRTFRGMSAALALALIAAPGVWHLRDVTAPLDGRRDIAAALEADSTIIDSIGRPFRPLLVLSCDRGRPTAALQWAGYVGRSGYDVAVSWRVDAGPIQNQRWWVGRSVGGPLFVRNAGWARELAAALQGGRSLVIRAAGQDSVFTVPSDQAALAAVRAVCP